MALGIHDWEVGCIDVGSAYLNSTLQRYTEAAIWFEQSRTSRKAQAREACTDSNCQVVNGMELEGHLGKLVLPQPPRRSAFPRADSFEHFSVGCEC